MIVVAVLAILAGFGLLALLFTAGVNRVIDDAAEKLRRWLDR